MLKVGARAHDYGRNVPEVLFKRIAEDGFEAVMLAFQKAILGINSYFDVTDQLIERTKVALDVNGIEIQTLGVYMELGIIDEEVRKEAVKNFIQGIHIAKKMGVSKVATETTSMHKQPQATRQEAYRQLSKSMKEILPEAERLEIYVCVEPVFYHTLNTPELAREFLDTMKSEYLKITFDAVNLLRASQVSTQHDLWDKTFNLLGNEIEVVHMKGVTINEKGTLQKANFKNSVVDYPYIVKKLKELGKPLHIIREEVEVLNGKEEAMFLKKLCQ
ncbi:sugar phosphate isomerase/epimerase [Niameybacter massiliensis]|uniref:Sugar phosphate isomerase/epimerase n=1 Tax=Holtiella tumoricola TaxID=3018743 RepID=A0AA42DPP7_9FIRM|nr:sugar phosphate isomerase/epimerase family protein [Holtiella tumoricola]MDA3732717.1 sugar phosphate isomerase/epimerase [Holtiella tumoricola]